MLSDQKELLSVFNAHGVKYLVVGGHAVSLYSEPRGTKDLDVFIQADHENSLAVFRALAAYGAPLAGLTPKDFEGDPESVFQIGLPPGRVDVLQGISGVEFAEAWEHRFEAPAAPGLVVYWISKEDLIRNKLASGRDQDLLDVKKLRSADTPSEPKGQK